MGLEELENALFKRWQQERGYDTFITDGAPCPEQFAKEKTKITFVLKEPHAFEEDGLDMRHLVDWYGGDSKNPNTWNNLTYWTQAILEDVDFSANISIEDRIRWLKRISFLNLKKVGGKSSATSAEIWDYAKDDAVYIYEQLSIYKPDIIVCCGLLGNKAVADCLAELVFDYKGDWQHRKEGDFFCWFYTQLPEKIGQTAVLNFYHPLNLGTGHTNKELFDIMVELSQKINRGGL